MINSFQIHPVSFIKAMSRALELSSVGISVHHRRTAIIARFIALEMGISQNQLRVLIYASLLHDIGAASNWQEKHFIVHSKEDDLVFNHAEAGYYILRDSLQLGVLAEPIRYHHDRFCGGNPSGLVGKEIPLLSRIIHLADRIEVHIDMSEHIFMQRDKIVSDIEKNPVFDPDIVMAFKKMSKADYFWLDIVNTDYINGFLDHLDFFGKLLFDIEDLTVIAEIFAKVVDATSHYTATHSKNVALVARDLSIIEGFSEEESKQFYLAGLLHDLGKLSIPNEMLNKAEKLSSEEYEIIKQHPYYSYRILEEVDGFETIASWVGYHHETLDGKGYPFRLEGNQISLGSKIIATADIYCALIEQRPYRACMTSEQAFEIMEEMVIKGKLDHRMVKDLRNNITTIHSYIDIHMQPTINT